MRITEIRISAIKFAEGTVRAYAIVYSNQLIHVIEVAIRKKRRNILSAGCKQWSVLNE